jgi:hypothetical protein
LFYSKRGIDFDQIYAWEYSLIEPAYFWKLVPPKVFPFLHFFNIPVTSNISSSSHILRMMETIVNEEDFVSWKLDIDSPTIEIPIILELMSNKGLSSLIDDFFFELHFRCEFLMYCGWTTNIPEEFSGLKLDRYNALKVFSQLRENGIRAHIWP